MAAVLNVLRSAFAGISPRERGLLISVLIVLGVLAFGGVYFWSSSALDDIEHERAAAVDALRTIRNERPRIRQRQERRDRMLARYATHAPPLTSFIEQASSATHVTLSEASSRPAGAATGRFQRRAVAIRLRRVDLQSLVNFMDRIDAATFPVAITSIRIRKIFGESNTYDVDDMVISTWDRSANAPTPVRGRTTPGGSAGTASNAADPDLPTTAGGRR